MVNTKLEQFVDALHARYAADMRFGELRKAVQALSRRYVAERARGGPRAALGSAGKRRAFGLFYGALHFLLVGELVQRLGATDSRRKPKVDLGCGTGVAGAAWAIAGEPPDEVIGVEQNKWAAAEARWTLDFLGLRGRIVCSDATRFRPTDADVVAAFFVNELSEEARERLLGTLRTTCERGGRALIIESIARTPVPWWDGWADVLTRYGGRADEWRIPVELPKKLSKLDTAAGFNHRVLKARTLYVDGKSAKSGS